MVSHFKIRPVVSVSINTDFISDSNDFLNSSASAFSDVAYTVLPGNTPSRSGDAIFIPAAACTSSIGLNLSLGSRISSNGFGSSNAFGLVTITESLLATITLSSFFKNPSTKIIFAVGPKPTSSLTSRIMPRVVFSSCSSFFFKYCCVKPTNTPSNSGIPTPVLALIGTIETSLEKS